MAKKILQENPDPYTAVEAELAILSSAHYGEQPMFEVADALAQVTETAKALNHFEMAAHASNYSFFASFFSNRTIPYLSALSSSSIKCSPTNAALLAANELVIAIYAGSPRRNLIVYAQEAGFPEGSLHQSESLEVLIL